MKAAAAWAEKTRDRSWLGRFFVAVLAALAFGLQAAGVYYDINWHTLQYTSAIKVDDELVVFQLGTGAEEAGFRVGDRLLRIDGEEIATLRAYRGALNRHPVDTWAPVELQRDDQILTLSVLVKRARLDLRFVVRNLIVSAFIAMGTLVAFQRFEDKAARLFFLAALALGIYFALLGKEVIWLVYVQIFVLTLAPGLALHFFLAFPQERLLVKTRWWFLLYVPSLILMVLTMQAFHESVVAGTGIWYSPRYEMLKNIGFAYLALAGFLGLVSLGYIYTTTPRPIEKRQLQWIMWGLACATVAGIVDLVLTLMEMQTTTISGLLLMGVLLLPVAFAFAILRYRLLDIDLVANRSVVYGVLTAVLVALYLVLISVLSNALGIAAGSGSYTVVVFLSALVIGILANPVRARIQSFIDRIFFRQQVNYQHALIQWSQKLSTSIRFADLMQLLTRQIPRQLMIERAWLLILNEDETRLEALPAQDTLDDHDVQVRTSLAVSALGNVSVDLVQPGREFLLVGSERGTWIRKREGEHWTPAESVPVAWGEAGVRVALPLVVGGQLVGVYLLGKKLSGDIYQRQELDLLRTLVNQAAVSIANARLYEQVHAFSQELEVKVQERTKELRDFVSVVYHELSTPMTAIRGYTALLLNGKGAGLQDKQCRYLQTIRRNVERLMRLVADLSDVSKIDDGRLMIHPEPLDLQEAVEETVNSLSGIIEEKGLQIDVTLASDTKVVLGDPQRVVQILTNLIGNACRYTPAGGQIAISSVRVNGSAEMKVSDTGIGIQKDELDHIFDRFYRSGDPLVQEHSGTGLGLAITKSLVELHGSELWVESEVGRGSTFGFVLPLAEASNGQ